MTLEELQTLYPSTKAPADNISTGYVKPSIAPTSGGVRNVVEGDDIETQIAQLPEEIAHWARSADQRTMELINDKTGQVTDRRLVGDFSDLDLVKMGLSFVPGMGPILAGVNVADAARRGDWTSAVIGATGFVPGMQNVGTALRVGQAIDQNNPFGAITALAGNSDVQNLTGLNNINLGGADLSAKDILKSVGTAQALSSGNNPKIFKTLLNLADSNDSNLKSSLGPGDMDQFKEDLIPGYFQPGGEGYIDPNRDEMTVREDPEGLDAFLRSLSPYATDTGTSVFAQTEDIPEMETVAKRPTSLMDILGSPDILQTVKSNQPDIGEQPEMVITDKRPETNLNSLRTKEIKSDIPDEITADQIDKLFPNININDILQTIPGGTTTVTPTKTVTPTTTPGTITTEQALANLGLNAPMPSQDPYANIKLMEELFGGNTDYKLRALGAPKNQASTDMDALARLLRG